MLRSVVLQPVKVSPLAGGRRLEGLTAGGDEVTEVASES
jgi:hypothetical protein